jgi:hypothetical protein
VGYVDGEARVKAFGGSVESFVFLVPVAPLVEGIDVEIRNVNLEKCILSILRSSDTSPTTTAQVVAVSHDRPDVPSISDERVTLLRVSWQPPKAHTGGAGDKFRKRQLGASWVATQLPGSHYVMGLDADDLVSPALFASINLRKSTKYFVLNSGYYVDFATRTIAVRRRNFFKQCGSSFVGKFSSVEMLRALSEKAGLFYDSVCGGQPHSHVDSVLQANSCSYEFLDDPVVSAQINHGINLTLLRGKTPPQIRHDWEIVLPTDFPHLGIDVFSQSLDALLVQFGTEGIPTSH